MKILSKKYKQKDIRNVECAFLDTYGKLRVLTIPKSRVKDIKKTGLKCDGSSINYQNKIEDSDMTFFLDLDSQYLLPNKNILYFCNTDFEYDARAKLKGIEKILERKKYKLFFGAELEFFLFDKNNLQKYSDLEYFEYSFNKQFECLNEIMTFCEKTDVCIEAFHHECGKNQFEINFKYDSPTKTADNIVYLKMIIDYFANKHGLTACFMPKPIKDTSGSGMHINISAFWKNKNKFYDKNDKNYLSKLAYRFIQGIFAHIGAITAVANPNSNSYERLNFGFEAPNEVKYSAKDRSALVRIPKADKTSTRIELRSPDISCNPYVTFLAIIKSGFGFLLGEKIKNKKTPKKLPKTLFQALKELKRDNYLCDILSQNYIEIAKQINHIEHKF